MPAAGARVSAPPPPPGGGEGGAQDTVLPPGAGAATTAAEIRGQGSIPGRPTKLCKWPGMSHGHRS